MTSAWERVLAGSYAVTEAIGLYYKEARRTVTVRRQKHWRMTIVKAIAARAHGWKHIHMLLPKGMQVTI